MTVEERLGRIEARLDSIERRLSALEEAVISLQRWRWSVSMIVALVAGAAGGKIVEFVRWLVG
ncbi:MAG: hypothetical protein ACK42I_02465 [Thermomicrobium sp.]